MATATKRVLYSDVRSGSCRRVLTVIEHLGLDDVDVIDILGGETTDFLKLNPNGELTVLVDGDLVLHEASAIALYLCDERDTDLVPKGKKRFEMLTWMFWAAEHFRIPAPISFEEHVVGHDEPDQSSGKDIDTYAPVLDAHLATRKFVLGDTPTLADIDLAAPLSQMPIRTLPYDKFPNVVRWYADLDEALPAWNKVQRQAAMNVGGRPTAPLDDPLPGGCTA
mmetsp:Transcript_36187/g.115892  ORF Transcript_36187/g.115892 Transcript_36187/m.115892 type:complete len:223 (+) Transcript_36187:108-776(+)